VGAKKEDKEEMVECRTDHYQTPRQVIVSVFGKAADKQLSKVTFESEAVSVFPFFAYKRDPSISTDTWGLALRCTSTSSYQAASVSSNPGTCMVL
jgi:hypothetical protein